MYNNFLLNILVFFALLVLKTNNAFGDVLDSCTCGRSNQPFESRIVGGSITKPHEYPWLVAIVTSGKEVFCGGSIVSSRHILSAGHCPYHDIAESPLSPYRYAVLGMHDAHQIEDSMIYDIDKVIMHPDWTAYEAYDKQDMAIYQTAKPIQFSDNVLPVCLPTSPKDYAGVKAIAAGWGLTTEGGQTSQLLQEARLKVLGEKDCEKDEQIGALYSPDSMMCAFSPGKDACQGDSGGPLFHQTGPNRYEQIGVTSFGIGCGKDLPAIYTKVSTSLEWIHSVIDKADTCQDPDAA